VEIGLAAVLCFALHSHCQFRNHFTLGILTQITSKKGEIVMEKKLFGFGVNDTNIFGDTFDTVEELIEFAQKEFDGENGDYFDDEDVHCILVSHVKKVRPFDFAPSLDDIADQMNDRFYSEHAIDDDAEVGYYPKEDAKLTQMEYEIYPQALEHVIRQVNKDFKGDIIVTENGIAITDDEIRCKFIDDALQGVKNCIDDNIPVKGYCYWSLLDNFEWQKGYSMTFGLIAVDRDTMKREEKPSLRHLGSYI